MKAADDGSANDVDRVELIDYLLSFEQSRNRLPLSDHALIHAAEQQDLAQQLCHGSTRQLLVATPRISKGEAARRVPGRGSGRAAGQPARPTTRPDPAHLAAVKRAGTISPEHVAIVELPDDQLNEDRPHRHLRPTGTAPMPGSSGSPAPWVRS